MFPSEALDSTLSKLRNFSQERREKGWGWVGGWECQLAPPISANLPSLVVLPYPPAPILFLFLISIHCFLCLKIVVIIY